MWSLLSLAYRSLQRAPVGDALVLPFDPSLPYRNEREYALLYPYELQDLPGLRRLGAVSNAAGTDLRAPVVDVSYGNGRLFGSFRKPLPPWRFEPRSETYTGEQYSARSASSSRSSASEFGSSARVDYAGFGNIQAGMSYNSNSSSSRADSAMQYTDTVIYLTGSIVLPPPTLAEQQSAELPCFRSLPTTYDSDTRRALEDWHLMHGRYVCVGADIGGMVRFTVSESVQSSNKKSAEVFTASAKAVLNSSILPVSADVSAAGGSLTTALATTSSSAMNVQAEYKGGDPRLHLQHTHPHFQTARQMNLFAKSVHYCPAVIRYEYDDILHFCRDKGRQQALFEARNKLLEEQLSRRIETRPRSEPSLNAMSLLLLGAILAGRE